MTAFTAAKAAISNAVYHDNDEDYAGHSQHDTSERTGFDELVNLVVSNLHVAVDARCVGHPGDHYVELLRKLCNVDQ